MSKPVSIPMCKLSVKELLELKGVRQISFVQVARAEEAIAAAQAGIDMIGTAFGEDTYGYPALIPQTHFQFGLTWGRHANADEALRDAMKAMEAGAQSIYCGMSPQVVEVLAREGVPVIAHVGLVPPKATWVGGMRAVGRNAQQASQVFHDCKAFESAGAFAVEMEVVAAKVAAEITQRLSMLTISLGSGSKCDVTYLFSADLLGENTGHIPRHAKTYRNFAAQRDFMQQERIEAYMEFNADVTTKSYPNITHDVAIEESEFSQFINNIS
ncbi:MAG: 3-methyl-2-oxobutanoate hydroxymethyltransferase [Pseudomonadales bacterium]|jgi:3-methyl-2-oxobutanoate hydroxymethyltransferase